MKKIITSFLLLCVISVAAHEFWLQPSTFIYKRGEKIIIKFLVGEDFTGENWSGDKSRIASLFLYDKTGSHNMVSPIIPFAKGDSLQLIPIGDNEGSYMIAFNSNNSFIDLEAAKFNAYLEEDGLRNVIDYRKEHNEMDSAGHEAYQRSVKTIYQVGKKYDSSFMKRTELPLDIVPLNHPLLTRDGQKISFKVFFNKTPLADQLIKIWYKEKGKTIKEELLTDPEGIVSFRLKKSGTWMISTVKMIRLENDPKAQWQSYWGSCTWGYE